MLYTAIIAKAKLAFGVIVCQRSKQPRNGTGGLKVTCKDCVHVDVCEEYGEVFSLIKGGKCSLFKDRSRFVELPCKVGDPLFTIQQRCTEKGYYSEKRDTFISDCEYCSDGVCDKEFYIKETRFNRLSQIVEYYERYILDSSFEKYRKEFHIKEEAEQALKERET